MNVTAFILGMESALLSNADQNPNRIYELTSSILESSTSASAAMLEINSLILSFSLEG